MLFAQKFSIGKLDDIWSGFNQEIPLSTTRSNVTTTGNTSVKTEIDPRHRTSYSTSISDFTVSTAHARRSDVVTLGGVNKRKRASLPERLSISTRTQAIFKLSIVRCERRALIGRPQLRRQPITARWPVIDSACDYASTLG